MTIDAANEPRVYTHTDCGTATQMPDSVRAKYLYDPYFYTDGMTICAECGMIPDSACSWNETGENLDEYMKRLQGAKGSAYHIVRWGIWIVFMIIGSVVAPGILAGGKGKFVPPWDTLTGALFGGLAALFIGRYIRFVLCRIKLI